MHRASSRVVDTGVTETEKISTWERTTASLDWLYLASICFLDAMICSTPPVSMPQLQCDASSHIHSKGLPLQASLDFQAGSLVHTFAVACLNLMRSLFMSVTAWSRILSGSSAPSTTHNTQLLDTWKPLQYQAKTCWQLLSRCTTRSDLCLNS